MRARLTSRLAACVLLVATSTAAAQSQLTEHTFKLDDPDARPAAKLEEAGWLTGSWAGDAFGGTFEQVWNPASAGSMVGLFKLMNGGEVSFYEILLLVEEEGSLSLKVKHFTPEFIAWEEKEDYTRFRFVKADADAIHFSGISFYRHGDDEMHAYLVMRNGDSIREEKLVYRRQ